MPLTVSLRGPRYPPPNGLIFMFFVPFSGNGGETSPPATSARTYLPCDLPCDLPGDVPNVCFPSAAVVEGDRIRLYYGCADTCIGLAEAKLADVVDYVKEHSFS